MQHNVTLFPAAGSDDPFQNIQELLAQIPAGKVTLTRHINQKVEQNHWSLNDLKNDMIQNADFYQQYFNFRYTHENGFQITPAEHQPRGLHV